MPGMPTDIMELEFNKDGAFVDRAQLDAFLQRARGATDVIVMSHGWNNDMAEARNLYAALAARLAAQLPNVPAVADRTFVLAGVLWPSKKFADDELIPGGAASAGDAEAEDAIRQQLDQLEQAVDPARDPLASSDPATAARSKEVHADFQRLRDLVPQLEEYNTPAMHEFVEIASRHLGAELTTEEEVDAVVPEQLRSVDLNGDPLLEVLGRPFVAAPTPGSFGGATSIGDEDDDGAPPAASRGGAAGIGDFFAGVKGGALNFLNVFTYYTMKSRAGAVGRTGVHEALRAVAALPNSPRIHLVGHSFGCRVMAAAALGADGQPPVRVHSMTLLQAAFSHFSFAEKYEGGDGPGVFRKVVGERRVTGPLVITHTRNDKAVGVAYAVASRLARQVAQSVVDAHDKYGELGSNGAQATPEARSEEMHAAGTPYEFESGAVHNLRGNQFISGHSDVASDATAYVILSAAAT